MKLKNMILTIFTFAVLLAFAPSVKAAQIPVIKDGKSTTLSGSLVKIRYGKKTVVSTLGVSSQAKVTAIKIGSHMYVPCKTLFSDNTIKATCSVKSGKMTLKYGKRRVVFYPKKAYASVNGRKMNLPAKPFYVTYKKTGVKDLLVPVKQSALFLGLKYAYSSKSAGITLAPRKGIHASATQVSDVSKSAFIKTLGPIARANYKRTGVLASVPMAQAILESGWGQSTLAENGNNLFGMKINLSGNNWSGSAWDGLNYYKKKTYEYSSRGRYTITAKFRKYSCLEDSVEDHSAYLLNAKNGSRKRYSGLTSTKSYKKQLQIIKKGGYATSGSYVSDLCKVILKYNLTKWEKIS